MQKNAWKVSNFQIVNPKHIMIFGSHKSSMEEHILIMHLCELCISLQYIKNP
jgi:hypothetical protein